MASSNEADSVRIHPWVSYTLSLLLLAGSLGLLLTGPDVAQEASKSKAMHAAIAYFERNPDVEVSARMAGLMGAGYIADVRASHEERRQRGGVAVLSKRMLEKSQKRFDAAQRKAFASLRDLPSWRFGIVDDSSPFANTFVHLAVNESGVAIAVGMVFFVLAAITLEGAWGSLLFGGFCLLLPFVTRAAYTSFYGDQGVPWSGVSGMVAGLLGAYAVRSFRGFTIPIWLLLPAWIVAEYLLVRDLPIDHFDSAPVVVHALSFAFGAAVAGLIWVLGLEEKMADRHGDSPELLSNPVLEQALQEREYGNADAAFDLLEAELQRAPGNHDVAVALWQVSTRTERATRAAPAMLGSIRDALRAGRRDDACALWLSIAAEVEPRAEGTLLVRIGETLLAAEEHEAGLHALAKAVDGAKTLSSVLAIRVVRGARDLDPELASRAAAIALIDDQLGGSERASLQVVIDAAEALSKRTEASAAGPGAAAGPGTAPASRGAAAPQREPDPLQDPHALSANVFEELAEGDSLAGEDPETWNQPGLVADLSEDNGGDGGPRQESEDLAAVEDLSNELEDAGADFDWSGLQDDESGVSLTDADTDVELGEPPQGSETSETTETLEPEEPGALDLPGPATRRHLRVRDAVPLALEEEGLRVEVEGGAKTLLPYERIEAVAAAAVQGLADRPVLVVDVVLNWQDVAEEPLKIVRLRSDGFDPRSIAAGSDSALESLRAMLDQLLARSGATPLPGSDAARGNPFTSFPDIDGYNRDVLMAE